MQSRFLRSVAVAAVLIVSLVGCSGGIGGVGGGGQGDPATAVKSAMDAAQSGGIAKLADYTCAAKKGDIATMFGGGASTGGLGALGLTADDIAGAMKMEFKDIQTTETSKSGNNAVVHVKGNMSITMDPAKMRELMKKVLQAQGQPADDVTLNAIVAGLTASPTTSQALDEDIPVVQENGKWVLCQ
jgi:hypothetical protein